MFKISQEDASEISTRMFFWLLLANEFTKTYSCSYHNNSGGLIQSYQYQPESMWGTAPLSMIKNGEANFYQHDQIGTPNLLTSKSGEVRWQGAVDAFGKVTTTTSSIDNVMRFPGQYFDSETGLHYNYFRDYDPEIGRYIQSDPIGLGGGVNTYGYVGGNPVNAIDPLGLDTQYSFGVSGTIAFFGAAGGGLSFGISVPDDWTNYRCYQLFGLAQSNSMYGIGAYAGIGFVTGGSESNGPLETLSTGTYRYLESDIGWGFSGGFSAQGTNEISGSEFVDNVFNSDTYVGDSVNSIALNPLPRVGVGYGFYGAIRGFTQQALVATPTMGDDCECG